MTPSKRFVIASFFAAITISVLCNNIFNLLDRTFDLYSLLYSTSFLMFLIKYFVDDVVDDRHDETERITRNSLAMLVVGWTFFLLSSLFANDLFASAVLWFIGLFAISIFLHRNRKAVEHHATLYLLQNIALLVVLCLVALSTFPHSLIASSCSVAADVARCRSPFEGGTVICLALFNGWFFIVLLRDDRSPSS